MHAVLFDIDRTLLDHDAAARAAVDELLVQAGLVEEPDRDRAWDEWERLEEIHYPAYLAGDLTLEEHRLARAAGLLRWLEGGGERQAGAAGRSAALETEARSWFSRYLDLYRESWRPFGDVEACLDAIGERARGVITNAEGRPQRAKLATMGLTDRLPIVIASGEVGVAKPDPEIFAVAAAAVGDPPERIVYVGDHLETDALGANSAGMTGVWVDRAGNGDHVRARAAGVEVITTLEELPSLLEELPSVARR